jgi:hypothetical protein
MPADFLNIVPYELVSKQTEPHKNWNLEAKRNHSTLPCDQSTTNIASSSLPDCSLVRWFSIWVVMDRLRYPKEIKGTKSLDCVPMLLYFLSAHDVVTASRPQRG